MAGAVIEMSGLITNPGKIWLAVEPVDMRRGIDGLSMVVQQSLQHAPCVGSAFVFCNRASNRIKVLLWDGTGVWLCQRRLHQGKFVWPKLNERCFTLTQAQWNWLIAGVDWQEIEPHTRRSSVERGKSKVYRSMLQDFLRQQFCLAIHRLGIALRSFIADIIILAINRP